VTTVLDHKTPAGATGDQRILQLYRTHLSKGRATVAELFGSRVEVASAGSWVETSDGSRFLNCGGYGVFVMGARHPLVLEAVRRQLETHPAATRIMLEPTTALAAEALCAIAPPGLSRTHFALSGAEAVEAAIKLARANGRRRIVAMERGFHGKTLGALSATADQVYRRPFEPLLPDVTHLPFGDAERLEQELSAHPGEVCLLVEPVQGEGGVRLPPDGYLDRVAALCREHGAIFVLDEVQSGMGRLGRWWGADLYGVVPDILLAGKALGGGVVPVSAMLATPEVFQPFNRDPYIHTGTFSGAPLAMAAVRGAIDAVVREDLLARAAELGARLLPSLAEIARRNLGELLVEVRGAGLLIGVELADAGLVGELLAELCVQGVLANHSMSGANVLRLTPPAVLTDEEAALLLESFDRATARLAAKPQEGV
jgi:putrescine aminotransferase